jgi:hypothetical protein
LSLYKQSFYLTIEYESTLNYTQFIFKNNTKNKDKEKNLDCKY